MIFFRKPEEESPRFGQDLIDLRAAVEKARLPEHTAAVTMKELERLEKTDPSAAEYSIGMNYIEYLISLPWHHFTEDNLDLKRAERILESNHYGLKHVKERILEYLAVRTLCSLRTFQILVVDDEEIARNNLEYILKKEGYQVSTAANGLEAMEKVSRCEFDLILTLFFNSDRPVMSHKPAWTLGGDLKTRKKVVPQNRCFFLDCSIFRHIKWECLNKEKLPCSHE